MLNPALRGVPLMASHLHGVFGMCGTDLVFFRCYASAKVAEKRDVGKVFRKAVHLPRDETKLVQMLCQNVCHDKDEIIALTKAPGVPVGGHNEQLGEMNVVKLLPKLGEALCRPGIEIVTAPERSCSGLMLLGESKVMANHLQEVLTMDVKTSVPNRCYLAITKGIPKETEGVVDLALQSKEINGKCLMFPVPNPSARSIRYGSVKKSRTFFKVISKNEELDCALLEVKPQKLRKDQIQVHLASILCPVIGDEVYSSRVQTVLGTKVLMDPSLATNQTQTLPSQLVPHLGVSKENKIPLLLHWHQLTLSEWKGIRGYTISAPLMPYFTQAKEVLGLRFHKSLPGDVS